MTAKPLSHDELADAFAQIASEAGRAILAVYAGDIAVAEKADHSPVSLADTAAEAIIVPALHGLLPGVPVIAEEAAAAGDIPAIHEGRFLLVDPLDGTKEFIDRNGEFTVNIALIENGVPVAGIVYAPLSGRVYLGGETARLGRIDAGHPFDPDKAGLIRTRAPAEHALDAVASRSHCCSQTKGFLARGDIGAVMSAGSALKFGLLAEGCADVYPRFSPTMEWDTAAGHAVLRAAGGDLLTPEGAPFTYGKADAGFRNGAFIAWGRAPE